MTASSRLSARQRAILEALAAGTPLRWAIHHGHWRYVLGDAPADARSAGRLIDRGLVAWSLDTRHGDDLELTEAGWNAVGVDAERAEG